MSTASVYEEILRAHTVEGELYRILPGGKVQCYACGHECKIREGLPGICKVRYHRGGRLFVPAGYVGVVQCDPTEKKPFFHVYPGSDTLTFGMLGCDFHCGYCQNWITSQALRDKSALAPLQEVTAQQLVSSHPETPVFLGLGKFVERSIEATGVAFGVHSTKGA